MYNSYICIYTYIYISPCKSKVQDEKHSPPKIVFGPPAIWDEYINMTWVIGSLPNQPMSSLEDILRLFFFTFLPYQIVDYYLVGGDI